MWHWIFHPLVFTNWRLNVRERRVEYAFGTVTLELVWVNSKSNCVVLIHVRNSLPSNILSPDLKMPAHSFCVQRVSFVYLAFYNLSVVFMKKKRKKKDLISLATKCLWGRLLVLATGKGLLERRISVPWLKWSLWQPVIKAPATFSQTLHPGGPFPCCWQSICICEQECFASTHPIRETLRCRSPVQRCLIFCPKWFTWWRIGLHFYKSDIFRYF